MEEREPRPGREKTCEEVSISKSVRQPWEGEEGGGGEKGVYKLRAVVFHRISDQTFLCSNSCPPSSESTGGRKDRREEGEGDRKGRSLVQSHRSTFITHIPGVHCSR